MVTVEEIEKLARLSRIALAPEEKEGLRREMDSILGYVEQVNKVSTGLSADKKAGLVRNALREDAEPHQSGIFSEEMLSAAPQREGRYIRVKKIL